VISFSSLKKLESDTVRAIVQDTAFARLTQLHSAARQVQGHINVANKQAIDVHLSFELPTRIREEGGGLVPRRFHVGCAAARYQDSDALGFQSYSVAIEKAPGSRWIARKFHFDYEPNFVRNELEPKPTFHLQLCGNLSRHHIGAGIVDADVEHLLPAWSKPRVPASPMSLALVLEWLFIEFGTEHSVQSARKGLNWTKIVRRAEAEVLRPYYERCMQFMVAEQGNTSFLWKRIYRGDD
jgi:hypothetical protein